MSMVRCSARRLATTLFVVLSLLFSQLALANYGCPTPARQHHEMHAAAMAAGEPCESMGMAGKAMDAEQALLCHQHCMNAPQSVDPVQVPSVSLPAVVLVLVVPPLLDGTTVDSMGYADLGRTRPPPDPLFLSTLRLRV